jgi:hypothetical protein
MLPQTTAAVLSLAAFPLHAPAAAIGLESPAYVAKIKRQWGECSPLSMKVIEFSGNGDPAFGGRADDRVLGADGLISDHHQRQVPAVFPTIEAAHQAAIAIPNRRPGSCLGVLPVWR